MAACINSGRFLWDPGSLLDDVNGHSKFALLILNEPILLAPKLALSLWKRAKLKITVDGGTDRWLKYLKQNNVEEDLIPDFVTGDFDSVSKSALEYYIKKGSRIIETPDQNATDFTKAVMETAKWQEDHLKLDAVLAIVEHAGRLDQILANLNTLFLAVSIIACPVYQLSSNSLSWLLLPGKHCIVLSAKFTKGTCSLVPLGAPCYCVTTSGLKWDLDHSKMEFGELVSTSNAFSSTEGCTVNVECSSNLIWTIQMI